MRGCGTLYRNVIKTSKWLWIASWVLACALYFFSFFLPTTHVQTLQAIFSLFFHRYFVFSKKGCSRACTPANSKRLANLLTYFRRTLQSFEFLVNRTLYHWHPYFVSLVMENNVNIVLDRNLKHFLHLCRLTKYLFLKTFYLNTFTRSSYYYHSFNKKNCIALQ